MKTILTDMLPTAPAAGWQAQLTLGYTRRGQETILTENRHHGPLRVQRPLYPENDSVCHTYLLHPPGGIVGGDRLQLDLAIAPGGHALLTTPGATKFYRAGGRAATQRVHGAIADATLEWLPQETILYPGADADTTLHIDLTGSACFLGWEILCLGLPARGETFAGGRCHTRIRLARDGRPLFLDRLAITNTHDLSGPAGLRGHPVTGCFIATGVGREQAESLAECPKPTTGLGGTTRLGEIFLARYLGPSATEAREYFTLLWAELREALLGLPACPPRIWQT